MAGARCRIWVVLGAAPRAHSPGFTVQKIPNPPKAPKPLLSPQRSEPPLRRERLPPTGSPWWHERWQSRPVIAQQALGWLKPTRPSTTPASSGRSFVSGEGQRRREPVWSHPLGLRHPEDLGESRRGRNAAKLTRERVCKRHTCLLFPRCNRSAQQVYSTKIQLVVFPFFFFFWLSSAVGNEITTVHFSLPGRTLG